MDSAQVHLLDIGTESYGDCLVLRLPGAGGADDTWVLVDGGHRSDKDGLLRQFTEIFGHPSPFRFDLVIISHAHADHIGALPDLVGEGHVLAGHALIPDADMAFGPASADGQDAASDPVLQAVALLREEPPDDAAAPDALASMALDAAGLRSRYDAMRNKLIADHTDVVLFGSAGAAALQKLQKAFAGVGLKILGPARPALDRTAQLLAGATQQVADDARNLQNAGRDGADLLDALSALDATQRLGNLVNAQSVVCRFAVATPGGPRKILLGGDFQFAHLGTEDAALSAERDRLVQAVAQEAPFAFAKLSHHGSDNAVDAAFLDALGATDVLGICCGRGHPAHPDPDTLRLLTQRSSTTWIRTDRSGHLTVTINGQGVDIDPDTTNDAAPNAPDAAVSGPAAAPAAVSTPPVTPAAESSAAVPPARPRPAQPAALDSLCFDIPARATAVTVKFDLAAPAGPDATAQATRTESAASPPAVASVPTAAPTGSPAPATSPTGGSAQTQFQIGGGRPLPPLIFLTDSRRLAANTAPNVVAVIANAINAGGHRLCDVDTAGPDATIPAIAAKLRTWIDAQPDAQVVILGGYDVIPSQQVDAVPPETPAVTKDQLRKSDPDSFYVWCDDVYVDIENAGLPDLPISRLPDGHDSMFLLNTLQAGTGAGPARMGIRNSARQFIEAIFTSLPGTADLLVSGPSDATTLQAAQFVGSYLYYMLHGDYRDGKRFWGEQPAGHQVEAVNLGQLPTDGVDLAVLGCCWGALPASSRAVDWTPNLPITGRLPGQSIAFTLLAAGARAVIGCTGAHYSPVQAPYDTASGPFHRALWQHILDGKTPGAALHAAKYDFSSRLTTLTDANELAIAYKTLAQFTCLGLGC